MPERRFFKPKDLLGWFPYDKRNLGFGENPTIDNVVKQGRDVFNRNIIGLAETNFFTKQELKFYKLPLFQAVLFEALKIKYKKGLTSIHNIYGDFSDIITAVRYFFRRYSNKYSMREIIRKLHTDQLFLNELIKLISIQLTDVSHRNRGLKGMRNIMNLVKSIPGTPIIVDYAVGQGKYTLMLNKLLKASGANYELIATDINLNPELKQRFKAQGIRSYEFNLVRKGLFKEGKADIVRIGYAFRYVFREYGDSLLRNIINDVKLNGYIILEDFGIARIYKKISESKLEMIDSVESY
jgi:hypothetical protein